MSTMTDVARKAYDLVADRNEGRVKSLEDVYKEVDGMLPATAAAEIRRRAIQGVVDQEDRRRTKKGNRIRRPSSQLGFDGTPDWLEPDAFLPTMDGGRFRVRDGVNADWLAVLKEADEQAEAGNRARAEKYATYGEMAPYLALGMTWVEAYAAFQREQRQQADAADKPAAAD